MGILDRIKEIEDEMSKTQKNKATEHHLGGLKAKLAKYRTQLIEMASGGKKGGEGWEVAKTGDARVSIVGFPSVGKSTFISKITKAQSAVGAYDFTTLECVPGLLYYDGARIQILDLPGIIEGASEGIGRGRQVIATARTSDLILLFLDANAGEAQRVALSKELHKMGIRLNRERPEITFIQKAAGGIKFNSTCPLKTLTYDAVKSVLQEFKIHNAEILVRKDCAVDDFVDIVTGNVVYVKCISVFNKIDNTTLERVEQIADMSDSIAVSCEWDLQIEELRALIWKYLGLTRIYHKKQGCRPDLSEASIFRKRPTVRDICESIHKDMVAKFKYAMVWGSSEKHHPSRVGLGHLMADEDVIQLVVTK